jgi:hypothetical protein
MHPIFIKHGKLSKIKMIVVAKDNQKSISKVRDSCLLKNSFFLYNI